MMSGSNDHISGEEPPGSTASIADAVVRLKAGGLVAVPTETVYGLAADSTNPKAVAEIYRTKGRPDFNPLITHVTNVEAARKLGQFNRLADLLADKFWPGPLTLVVPKSTDCPVTASVTAGLDTIALRCPRHPAMRELLTESGLFLAAPSANPSGQISPTTADHVRQSLGADAPLILDGGRCASGLESTIVGVRGDKYQVLRPGPVTVEDIKAVAGEPALEPTAGSIEAPGQLASHYAPSKPLRLNAASAVPSEFHIGFGKISGDRNLSAGADMAEAASNLFAYLHEADASDRDAIAVAPVPAIGMGVAINDRLKRAATAI